jgi:hypothetical protein
MDPKQNFHMLSKGDFASVCILNYSTSHAWCYAAQIL